jgi:hypothetical protein
MYRFTHDEKARQKAIADWRTWWSEKGRDLPEDRRPEREPAKADPGK